MIFDETNPQIQVWRKTEKYEQSDEDGYIDRIEWGRELKISYETNSQTRTTFTVTLLGAMPGLIASSVTLLTAFLFF